MEAIKKLFVKSLMVLIFVSIVNTEKVFSQSGWIKPSSFSYGLQLNQVLNGSGHGLISDVNLIFRIRKSELALGGFSQIDFKSLSGESFQFKYFVTSNDYANLYVHYTMMYHYQNELNNNLNQQLHPTEYNVETEYEKFNTLSQHIGIGIETMVIQNFYIDFKVGAGGYFSSIQGKDRSDIKGISRDDNAPSVLGSIGLLYRFHTKEKKQRFGKYY